MIVRRARVFVSSPGDVAQERAFAERVIRRLRGELAGQVRIEAVLWEHEPLLATGTFQEQIVRPSECDVVVSILWSRLGTRLPAQFVRADGSRYASGTEFEFEDAVEGFRRAGRPELLVYRKTAQPLVSLENREALLERLRQKEALDEFVGRWFHDHAEGTLKAAFHTFETSGQFEELLETHLAKLLARLRPKTAPDPDATAALAPWKEGSPFRGLQPFEVEHGAIFFGRTRAVTEVLDALRKQAAAGRAFVMVSGMSGGGKSSLVRAGVVPVLTQSGVVEGIGLWRRAVMRPDDSPVGGPFAALATALLRPEGLPELTADGTGIGELAGLLRGAPATVVPRIGAALRWAAAELAGRLGLEEPPKARLLLVVDQLEQLLTVERLVPDVRRFLSTLSALAASGDVWVLATLRGDFYPRFAEIPELVALKEGSGQVDLLPPTPAEIGQMIRQPAVAAGLRFEHDAGNGERLEDLLRDAAVANPRALPLLEFTLEELYQKRTRGGMLTFAAYRELGGVEGALVHRAEQVFAALPAAVQAAFPGVMRALVSLAGESAGATAPASRRAPLAAAATSDEARQLVDAFAAARLFVAELVDGQPVVGIAHEALLRHWPRLAGWIEEDREVLRAHSRLAAATTRWLEEGRAADYLLSGDKPLAEARDLLAPSGPQLSAEERAFVAASLARGRRRQLLRRATAAVLAALTLLALGAAALANRQRARAEGEARRADAVSAYLSRMYQWADPGSARGASLSVQELLDEGVRRLQSDLAREPLTQATLMVSIGDVFRRLGNLDRAGPLLEKAAQIRVRELGEDDPKTAESLDRLGALQRDRGHYALAEQLFRRAMVVRARRLGDDAAEVADSLTALASLLHRDLGRSDEAEPLLRRALAIRRTRQPGTPALAETLATLAAVLDRRGKAAQAEELYRQALGIERRVNGEDHPDVADALNNLGAHLWRTERSEAAEALFRKALAIDRKRFGEDHPRVAAELYNIAQTRRSQGDSAGAEALFRQSLAKYERSVGPDHPEVASGLDELSHALEDQGKLAEAEAVLRHSLTIRRQRLGERHWHVSWSLHNLGTLLGRQGRFDEALPLLREALAIRRRELGDEHEDVASSWENLGELLRRKGDHDAALPLLRQALALNRKLYGSDARHTMVLAWNLASVEYLVGDYARAEALYREVADYQRRHGDTADLDQALAMLAGSLLEQGKAAAAEPIARELVAARRRLFAADSWQIGSAESLYGGSLARLGRHQQAEPLLLHGYRTLRKSVGADDRMTVATAKRLVELYEAWGKPQKAAPYRRAG